MQDTGYRASKSDVNLTLNTSGLAILTRIEVYGTDTIHDGDWERGGGLTHSLDSLAAAQVAKLKHTIVALSEPWVVSLHRIPHLWKLHARNDLMCGEMCDDFVTLP